MSKLNNLTKGRLIDLYLKEEKSLDDIGKIYDVSRVAVYKKLKKYGIQQRSKSEARLEAQRQGKLPQSFFGINENFFNTWSSEMAYVFGLIISDGCISKAGTVSLCINDKELLEKVKVTMHSEHKIVPSKHQKGLYYFHFARKKLVHDLEKLGVLPKKSLVVKFPEVPQEYLADFIRGVFDGDGSVFFDKRRSRFPLRSKFVSSSVDFINGLHKNLESLGMPKRKIYKQKTKNAWSYMFIFDHKDSLKLCDILYKNIQNGLFLERKYKRFLEGMQKCLKGGDLVGTGAPGVA